jgi:hypothetical protein
MDTEVVMLSVLLGSFVAVLVSCEPPLLSNGADAPDGETPELTTRPGATQDQEADDEAPWPTDPNPTRLLFGPTGRSLKRGEAYLDVYGISIPYVQVGLTDGISIGAGTPLLLPGLAPGEVFWISPKVRVFSGKKTDAAVGVLHTSTGRADNFGIVYGVVTRGTLDTAVTVGLGYTYRSGRDAHAPLVMVSGEKRVTRVVKVITENYIGRGGGFAMGGVRVLNRRVSADFGLGRLLGTEWPFPVPVIRFSYRFSPR